MRDQERGHKRRQTETQTIICKQFRRFSGRREGRGAYLVEAMKVTAAMGDDEPEGGHHTRRLLGRVSPS